MDNPQKTLLPCPFCGYAANLYHDDGPDYIEHWSYHAHCADPLCGAEGMSFSGEDDAIYWWNRRTTDKTKTTETIIVPKDLLRSYMHFSGTPDSLKMNNNFVDADTFLKAQQFRTWIASQLMEKIK